MSALQDCVLIVDDEALIVMGLRAQLEGMGIRVCGSAASADDAVRLADRFRPRLVLMDMRLQGDKDGVDAAIAIHDSVGSKVIFVTGSNEPSTRRRIEDDHPAGLLLKPVSDRQLRDAIGAAAPR